VSNRLTKLKSKTGFILRIENTNMYLKDIRNANIIGPGGVFSKIRFDWIVGKNGASLFDKENATKLITYYRREGLQVEKKPIKRSIDK
jgi:hypothetical protein